MSQNLVTLSCYFEKFTWRKKGETYNERFQKFDSISALISFPDIPVGTGLVLGPQKCWVSLDTPSKGKGDTRVTDAHQVSEALGAFSNGYQHALIWDGIFNVWGQDKGKPKHELKFGFRGFRLSRDPLTPLNRAVIQGKVSSHPAPWMTVEDVYHNPFAKDESKKWNVRPVPVYAPQLTGSINGRQVLVFGRFSAVAISAPVVAGAPLQTQPYVHVLAEEIHVCP